MVGSLYTIVLGPTSVEKGQPPLTLGNFNLTWFAVGVGIIMIPELVKQIKTRYIKSKSNLSNRKEKVMETIYNIDFAILDWIQSKFGLVY